MSNKLQALHGVSGLIFFTFFFQSNRKIQVGTKLSIMESLCYTEAYSCSSYKTLNRSLDDKKASTKTQFLCSQSVGHVIDIFCNVEAISENTTLVSVLSTILFY